MVDKALNFKKKCIINAKCINIIDHFALEYCHFFCIK